MYESEVTTFIRELLEKNPQLAEEQRKARATWWDKKVDLEEQKRYREAEVGVRGYYYYPLPKGPEDGSQGQAGAQPEAAA